MAAPRCPWGPSPQGAGFSQQSVLQRTCVDIWSSLKGLGPSQAASPKPKCYSEACPGSMAGGCHCHIPVPACWGLSVRTVVSLDTPKALVCSLQALHEKPQNSATAGPGEGSALTAIAPSMLAAGSCPSDKGRAQARVMLGLLQFQGWEVSETPYAIPKLAPGGFLSLRPLDSLLVAAQPKDPCTGSAAVPGPRGSVSSLWGSSPLGWSLH